MGSVAVYRSSVLVASCFGVSLLSGCVYYVPATTTTLAAPSDISIVDSSGTTIGTAHSTGKGALKVKPNNHAIASPTGSWDSSALHTYPNQAWLGYYNTKTRKIVGTAQPVSLVSSGHSVAPLVYSARHYVISQPTVTYVESAPLYYGSHYSTGHYTTVQSQSAPVVVPPIPEPLAPGDPGDFTCCY